MSICVSWPARVVASDDSMRASVARRVGNVVAAVHLATVAARSADQRDTTRPG